VVTKKRRNTPVRRLFDEIASGVEAMRDHREGRLHLRRHEVQPPTPVPVAAGRRAGEADVRIYQLKITLMETDPPIWRRVRIPGDTTLARLDRIIQTAMGWTNSHLHTFTAGGVVYADPSPEWEIPVRNERRTHLRQIVSEEGEAFIYEYDMGDSWRHQVLVEEVGFESGNSARPLCLGGERACPPEDCGGIHGYYETLEVLRDPAHEEYADTKIWIESMTGGPFDADAFDVEAVNRSLKRFR
jgi:hypothetical protein